MITYFIDFKLLSNSFPLVNDMKSNIKVIKFILEEVEDKIFNCFYYYRSSMWNDFISII